MAYEFERDEWRAAINTANVGELDRLADDYRRAIGVTGDPSDAADDRPDTDKADEAGR